MSIQEQLDAILAKQSAAIAIDHDETTLDKYGNVVGTREEAMNDSSTDIPKLLAALRHALAVAGEMRQGSHHDRIIRYGDMIGTIAGILDGEG